MDARAARTAGLVFDTGNLERLLTGISELFAERVIDESPTDLAQYGLKPPKAAATGTFGDGTSQTVFLGDKAPGSGTYYLQVKGDPRVYTVQMYDAEHFNWTANDLRSKTITPALNYDEISYLRLVERDGTVIEAKEKTTEESKSYQLGFGKYILTRPYPFRARHRHGEAGPAPEGAPGDYHRVHLPRMRPVDLARYGLARPWGEALVRDKANAITFLFGAKKNDTETYFMIKGQPTVYIVTTSSLAFMDTKPFDVVDKFIFIPNIDDVDRIDITVAGTRRTSSPSAARRRKRKRRARRTRWCRRIRWMASRRWRRYFKKFYQSVIGLQADGEVRRQVSDVPGRDGEIHDEQGTVENRDPGLRPL